MSSFRLLTCVSAAAMILGLGFEGRAMMQTDSNSAEQVVIEPDEALAILRNREAAPGVIWLDARSREAFAEGHVRNALWIDIQDWDGRAHSEAEAPSNLAAWRKRLGELGIAANSRVVVYDDGKLIDASRAWFLLRSAGVRQAAVLNGGYPAMKPKLSSEDVQAGAEFKPKKPVEWSGGAAEAKPYAAKGDMMQAVTKRSARVLDVRAPEEYSGEKSRGNPRAGHLPGAILLPHTHMLDASGRLLPAEDLKKLFAEAGLKPDEPIIAHCQSGGRASLALLAAAHAGYNNVRNYYGSFGEWSRDPQCPIE